MNSTLHKGGGEGDTIFLTALLKPTHSVSYAISGTTDAEEPLDRRRNRMKKIATMLLIVAVVLSVTTLGFAQEKKAIVVITPSHDNPFFKAEAVR